MKVTREAFGRYMRVIKRALTDAAVKLSADAATETLSPRQSQAPAEQSAGMVLLHAMLRACTCPMYIRNQHA